MSTSHVDRLLSKLPKSSRDSFIEHLPARGQRQTHSLNPYNLRDLAEWLRVKAEVQRLSSSQCNLPKKSLTVKAEKPSNVQKPKSQPSVTIYHGSETSTENPVSQTQSAPSNPKSNKVTKLCLFSKGTDHYLSQYPTIVTDCWPDRDMDCGGKVMSEVYRGVPHHALWENLPHPK